VTFLYRARRMQQSSYRRIVKAQIILKPRRHDSRSGLQFDPAFSTPIPPHVHFRLELITTWCNKGDAYFYASCGTRRSRRLLKFIGSPVASLLLLRYSCNFLFLFLSLSLSLSSFIVLLISFFMLRNVLLAGHIDIIRIKRDHEHCAFHPRFL